MIAYLERITMPPTGKLRNDEIAAVREWVKLGAPWSADAEPNATVQTPKKKEYTKRQQEFWLFRPIREVTPPAVKRESWVRSPIDQFILARLEEANLKPAPPADKLGLIRRRHST